MDTCFENNSKFTMAYSQYHSLVYKTTCHKVNCVYDADDICQNLFFELYNKIDTIRDIRAWIFTSIRYQILMYYRKRKSGLEDLVDLQEMEKISAPDIPIIERFIIDELMRSRDVFYDDLDREMFKLVFIENRSYHDTSNHINLSTRQIRYRYKQLMSRMLDHLKKSGFKNLDDIL